MISAPLRDDSFIGRDDELAFLLALARDVSVGSSCAAVIRGERGSGKSRLLDELRVRLPAGMRTVTVRCAPGASEPGTLLRVLYDALAIESRREAVSTGWTTPRLLLELRELILALKPVAIVAEDIENADVASLEIFERARELTHTLMIATFTPSSAPLIVEDALARARARGAYELTLAPLPPASIERLVRQLRHRGKRLSPVLVERIVLLSDGNPSLARDLFISLCGDDREKDDIIPAAIRTRCMNGLAQLSADARRIVLIAAAIGREFDLDLLCGVAECGSNDALEALQQATVAGLLHEVRRGEFRFEQALYQAALQAQSAPSWVSPIHRRIAQALEPQSQSADEFDRVAEHWLAADDTAIAARAFERAGDVAAAAGQLERASHSFRRALDAGGEDRERSVELLTKVAGALRRSGVEDDALTAFRELLTHDQAAQRGEASARALLDTMMLSWGAGDVERAHAIAHEILAMELPPSSSVKPMTLIKLAGLASVSNRHADTLDYLRQVEERYTLTDPELRAQFHQQRALATAFYETFDAAIDDFERGIHYAAQLANATLHVQLLCNYGNLALHVGRNDIAQRTLSLACERALECGSESKLHLAHASYVRMLQQIGALREARNVLAVIEQRDRDLESVHAYYAVVPMLEIGSMLDDQLLIRRALECDTLGMVFRAAEDNRIVPVAAAYATYYWYSGQKASATDLLQRTLDTIGSLRWNLWFAVLVAKFGRLSDVARARRLLENERSACDPTVAEAFLALFDAFVARRRGRNAAAGAAGKQSAKLFAQIGWPFLEAQAHEAAGSHTSALAIYQALGDVRDERILRASLRPSRYAAGHDVALSKREREIAALAANGLISKEIAQRLDISVRTVEYHLQVIYGKLGIRSRWQIPLEVLGQTQ